MGFDPQVIHSLPTLIDGWLLTVELTLLGATGSLVFGHLALAMQLTRVAPLRWAVRLYISFMRGTPALVQLFRAVLRVAADRAGRPSDAGRCAHARPE